MDLIYCLIGFSFLACLGIARNEASLLAILSLLLWCNKEYFSVTDDILYYNRATLAFIAGIVFVAFRTKLGIYQSVVQVFILISYACLAYDVTNKQHILIYNNFEAVINGLVICQLIGFFPVVWNSIYDLHADYYSSAYHSQRNQEV